MLGRALITVGTLAAVLCQLEGCAAPGGTIHVDLLLFPGPDSILRAERQRLLTFSRPDSPFRAADPPAEYFS